MSMDHALILGVETADGKAKENRSAALVELVPPNVVTVTSTVPTASTGDVAVIDVAEFTVNGAAVPPNLTAVAPVKPVPVIVTVVPPLVEPVVGLIAVTTGNTAVTVKWSAALVWLVPPGAVTVTS
jgi:hypothetical protein